MRQALATLARFARLGADGVAAAMLAAMFFVFILQIASRYVFGWSVGWTVEVCLTLWLWLVFWGCAFCLSDRDHVKFDIVYEGVRPRLQRAFALVSAGAVVVALAVSLPDTYDYVSFYRIKRSAVLRVQLHYVFSIYLVFAIVIMLRYLWDAFATMRALHADPDRETDAR